MQWFPHSSLCGKKLLWRQAAALLCAAGLVVCAGIQSAHAQEDPALYLPFAAQAGGPAPICRTGVNVTRRAADFPLADLRIGWYVDYHAHSMAPHPNGAAYAPVINLAQVGGSGYTSTPGGSALDQAIAGQPGADWIIGNEPDRRYYQNDLEPHVYAVAFHELAQYIRARDPGARIFAGAIVQPTPLRLQYLDRVLEQYRARYGGPLPADGWAIHNFILNERSCSHYNDPAICWGADIPPGIEEIDGLVIDVDELQKTADLSFFKEQVVRFRQWMADNGYRNLPLYVSEYGILMPEDRGFPPSQVNQFMDETFDYMLTATSEQIGYAPDNNRLVQRFAWYSTVDPAFNGSLFEGANGDSLAPPFKRTSMGDNYLSLTSNMPATSAFKLLDLAQLPLVTSAQGDGSVMFRAAIANAGNNQWPAPASIQFFWGDPAAGGVPLGSTGTSLAGCGSTQAIDFIWADVPPEADGQRVYARLQAPGVQTQVSVEIVLGNETRNE
jgi:hypothetical protein